ncbi:MAG: hypothetical protein K9J13_10160 [Saprospiraceae bacterium]|nr:hypothetical protein [Saprospiraceae bacterium]
MKLKSISIIILFLSIGLNFNNLMAQDNEAYTRTKYINREHINDFLFYGVGISSFSDIWTSPILGYEARNNQGYIFHRPIYTNVMSLGKLYFDTRMDIIQYDDLISLSLNAPVGIGLTLTDGDFHIPGILTVHLPAYLKLNFFRNSTKNRIDKFGFNLGFGYHYFLYPFHNYESIEEVEIINQGMTAIKGGFVVKGYKNSNHQLDFIIGLNAKKISYSSSFEDSHNELMNYYFSLAYVYQIK